MNNKILIFATVIALCASVVSAEVVWDALADFTNAQNPNGAWSYGYGAGPTYNETLGSTGWGGVFDYPLIDPNPGVGGWTRSMGGTPDYSPYILCNQSDAQVYSYPAHSLNLSSGTGGGDYHSFVRWTAPEDGWYQVDSSYAMMASDGTPWTGEMDVTTVINNEAVFSSAVSGFDYQGYYGVAAWPTYEPGPKTATGTYYLTAGSTVDFVAGIGWIDATSDFTNIAGCKVTAVPEPSSIALLGFGMVGLAAFVWRKR
jgi:hypothetical protein